MENKEKIKVSSDYLIIDALKLMDSLKRKLLIVMDGNFFLSVLSIGDIQRAIIKKIPLESSIKSILRKNISIARSDDSIEEIKKRTFELRAECMPVVNKENHLTAIYFWEDFFPNTKKKINLKIELPVVIMAGGKGERLKPLTNILPKPLIPIGDKTIVEEIMERFIAIGSSNFYLSIFYKSELIKYYFDDKKNSDYNVNFIEEEKPLGTGGSLHLLKHRIKEPFFVTNCDILIEQDYSEIYNYHKENKNEITIVSALNHFKFPYGIINTAKDGELISITEKPEMTYEINSGMYILEPNLLDEIPINTFFHITQLIEKVKQRKGKVGVFPVSEKSWVDIGDWKKYINEINVFSK